MVSTRRDYRVAIPAGCGVFNLSASRPVSPGFVVNDLPTKKIIARDYLSVNRKIIERDNLFLDAGSLGAYAFGL
jgi:hypothetical protein